MEDLDGRLSASASAPSPVVTCVVPVYNGARYVSDALYSILAQRHRPIDVIAVDDGSTDTSPHILASFGDAIRVVAQANAGPASARNAGVRAARGEFIAFLDQDDRWHHDKLTRQVAHLAEHPAVDVVVAHVESVWEGRNEDAVRRADQPRGGTVPGYLSSTMLARRQVFDRVGGFDHAYRFADSLDWFARAAELGVVVHLMPDVLLVHRVHGDNLSRSGVASRAECVRILKRALDRRRAAPMATT